jgi:hypothetical protein
MDPVTTKVRKHQWNVMAYQNCEILGEAPDGEPFGLLQGDPIQGVSCMACAQPWSKEVDEAECAGES